ncbi:tripartite motif-containing protein 16-like [Seriola dumerili]|uniref:tripartite motif-containing protein 16-like n=1 Tax=Seriola dumerili TaxID=41447 RepID=UPI000BBED38F|nr:tripartite motif-containing protein 16-like [Seriola dumerili]XP_022614749.1 tripartite motif-containing protein 16-like [Seriola dumerili]
MSLTEEPSQDRVQTESESRVHEDDFDREDHKDEDVKVTDLLQTHQRERRMISPLTLLKEDFSQFKEDVLKVFKDRDTKMEHEDGPPTQVENRANSSTLSLLMEDLSQFKEDMSSIFNISSSRDKDLKTSDPKTSQATEKTINPLSLLKEDLSNVFRISLSNEKDKKGLAAKEDSAKIKVQKAERMDDPLRSLFRRDQKLLKTSEKVEDSHDVKKTLSEKSEEQMDEGFRGKFSETVDAEKINSMKEPEDSEVDINVSEEKSETTTILSETQQHEGTMCKSQTADSCVGSGEDEGINGEKEEDKPSWTSLLSRISRFSLGDDQKDDTRDQTDGDVWWVKNFACYLTFDPSTANSELHLTDCNRKATRMWSDCRSLDHPDRFERCPQVLCREGLLDSVYWEVEWSGGADVGVTSNSISRDGDAESCLLGHNKWSWSLECSEGSYTPCHNNKRFRSSSPQPFTHRVGVYLNWSTGSLSFYGVSQDAMVHLHTFTSTFTEPLYPGFWVWTYGGSVTLCQVELDWERLLQ